MEKRRSALHASASAPVLPRDGGAYAHSERVERRVPPLALVPLDQLKRRRRSATEETEADERSHPSNAGDRPYNRHKAVARHKRKDEAYEEEEEELRREEQQQRLGERFLGMMALLARLRRMDLDEGPESPAARPQRSGSALSKPSSPARGVSATPAPTALEKLVEEKKRAEQRVFAQGGADAVRAALALSPGKRPEPVVNVATKPLREHLTFEISMLLPAPMDTRQSALRSPIERQPKRTKKKRRRRRRRRPLGATVGEDGKRTWQTSHVTWVAHASADYAQARAAERMAASSGSKLVAKFASLRTTPTSSADQRAKYLYATDNRGPSRRIEERRLASEQKERRVEYSRVEEEEEEGEGGEPVEEVESDGGDEAGPACVGEESEDDDPEDDEEEEEEDDDEEQADHVDTLPDLLPPASSSVKRPGASSSSAVSQRLRPVQTHQAAWISPELRTWLIHSGLFRTGTRNPAPH